MDLGDPDDTGEDVAVLTGGTREAESAVEHAVSLLCHVFNGQGRDGLEIPLYQKS